MARRPGNNPKRRIAPLDGVTDQQRAFIVHNARYAGSGHHKRNPAGYGLPRVSPRPTKSLCDMGRTMLLTEAQELMADGIRLGLFSKPQADGLPKYIWSVSQHGEVFEAKTDTHGSGKYHGYPLEDEDDMREYVKAIWKERCQNAGR